MRAVPIQETIGAGLVPVQDEIFAQQAHGFRCLVVQLDHGGDGHPVAPKQLSHRRASADLRQSSVLLFAQHRFGSSISVFRRWTVLRYSHKLPSIHPYGSTNSLTRGKDRGTATYR